MSWSIRFSNLWVVFRIAPVNRVALSMLKKVNVIDVPSSPFLCIKNCCSVFLKSFLTNSSFLKMHRIFIVSRGAYHEQIHVIINDLCNYRVRLSSKGI